MAFRNKRNNANNMKISNTAYHGNKSKKRRKITNSSPSDHTGKTLYVDEAATYLDVSESTIRYWIQHGQIENIKLGRRVRIPVFALDEKRKCAVRGVKDSESVEARARA